MTQVVQAKCPNCKNVLRIPAEWASKAMRCKHCKNTFVAKGKTEVSYPVAAPATAIKASVPAAAAQPAIATAVQAQPALAMPASSASSDPFGFGPDDAPAPPPSIAKTNPRKKKKGRGLLLLVLMFFFLFALGATGAGIVVYKALNTGSARSANKDLASADAKSGDDSSVHGKKITDRTDPMPGKDQSGPKDNDTPPSDGQQKKKTPPVRDSKKKDAAKDKKDGNTKKPIFNNDPFPRRGLLISVNNYLMFNNIHYGSGIGAVDQKYPGSSTAVLRDRLSRPPMYFPPPQVIELSDGISPDSKAVKPHSTQKSVIETTIKDFVDTSREQDRIIVLFAGHGVYLDEEKKSYLVPIDGNLKNTESLLPLQWVYDQLAKCRAQQKILILDLFRFSPSRGFELPSTGDGEEGKMPEGFDKDLLNPPPGLQVWSSAIKDQSSIELDAGGAFLQALCNSLQGSTEMTGISTPTLPIPIENLVVNVNKRLKELVTPEKKTQTSRLTGKQAEGAVLYKPDEQMPPKVELKPPTARGGDAAGYAVINNILNELIALPQVRETRISNLSATNLPAFSAKKMEAYKPEGYQNLADLQKKFNAGKEAFAKEFPLRAAYLDAVEVLQRSSRVRMREVLASPIDPKRKAAFLLEQVPLAESQFHLEQALAIMKDAVKEREKETSQRWQANFDYGLARLESRLVYLYEYNYTLGQIRLDNLPELAAGQSGWRVGISGAKITVTEKKAKDFAKDVKKLWDKIQERYPDTPWDLLAQRESKIALGLAWRPKSD